MRAYVHGARANPPRVVALILIGVVYFGLARLSLLLAFESTNASPVWPPSGFALTVLLAVGRRAWPALAVGAWIANAVTFVTNGAPLGAGVLLASFAIALPLAESPRGRASYPIRFCARLWLASCA